MAQLQVDTETNPGSKQKAEDRKTLPPIEINKKEIAELSEALKGIFEKVEKENPAVQKKDMVNSYTEEGAKEVSGKALLAVRELLKEKGLYTDEHAKLPLERGVRQVLWNKGINFSSSISNLQGLGSIVTLEAHPLVETKQEVVEVPLGKETALKITYPVNFARGTTRLILPTNPDLKGIAPGLKTDNPVNGKEAVIIDYDEIAKLVKMYGATEEQLVKGIIANEAAHVAFALLFPADKFPPTAVVKIAGDKEFSIQQIDEAFSDFSSYRAGQDLEFVVERVTVNVPESYQFSQLLTETTMDAVRKNYRVFLEAEPPPGLEKMTALEIAKHCKKDAKLDANLREVLSIQYGLFIDSFLTAALPEHGRKNEE